MRIFLGSFAILFLALLCFHWSKFLLDECFISKLFGIAAVSAVCSFAVRHFYHPRIRSSSKKAILITGCDTGFGHHLAKRMERQGFTVFACCLDATSEDSKQLSTDTGRMHVLQMNVADDEQIQSCVDLVKETLQKEGKQLWAVVNNAGIGELGFIEMQPIEIYQKIYDVNTMGTVRVSKAFIPFLRGHGRVINVTSLFSRISFQYFSAYAMSKHATLAFSNSLRLEMVPFNIKVVTVEPFFYRTNLLESSRLTTMIDNMWNSAKEDVRNQYGIVYVKACENRIRTRITKDPRANADEVVDTIEQAVWSIKPDFHYVPHAPAALKFKFIKLLPEYILDHQLMKAWYPREIEPAFVSRSTSS